MERLEAYAKEHHINEYEKCMLIDMSKKVVGHLTKKYSCVKEKVGAIMGGKILDYEAKDILNKGRAEELASIVQMKLTRGDSVEMIAADLMKDVSVIEEIVQKLQA